MASDQTSLSDDSGVLTVTLTPMEGQTFANGRIAMWSQQDGQDDLKWFRGEKQADETWVVKVPMCIYKDLWRYQIHAYDGSNLIAGTSINIVQTVTHRFTNYTVSTKTASVLRRRLRTATTAAARWMSSVGPRRIIP